MTNTLELETVTHFELCETCLDFYKRGYSTLIVLKFDGEAPKENGKIQLGDTKNRTGDIIRIKFNILKLLFDQDPIEFVFIPEEIANDLKKKAEEYKPKKEPIDPSIG